MRKLDLLYFMVSTFCILSKYVCVFQNVSDFLLTSVFLQPLTLTPTLPPHHPTIILEFLVSRGRPLLSSLMLDLSHLRILAKMKYNI